MGTEASGLMFISYRVALTLDEFHKAGYFWFCDVYIRKIKKGLSQEVASEVLCV